jgi:NAD(P)H-dependent flavin oxidoreductase YrpB (nitropropane dioxygenase family)
MPLQGMVTIEAISRSHRYAKAAKEVAFNPVGQIVGRVQETRPVREVVYQLVEEYLEAVERLEKLTPQEAALG